ncbi:MAG: hypothetical protein DRN57_02995 [Thermoplasmata archaeon]|nr:MAG: hypothetical protein DRN57_02995 [Thermoplasmata archaeon]
MMVEKRGISALEGMLVARSLMYSSVYFHKTSRIAEGMLCRAGEHLTDSELETVWKMSDGEVLRFMMERGGKAGELAKRLRFRRLYKSAFRLDSEMLSGEDDDSGQMREFVRTLADERERRKMESELERRANAPPGAVLVDVPDPGLVLSEPRLKRTDINVLGERPEPLSAISSLARALQRRPPVPWCLMVSCQEEIREDVARAAEKVVWSVLSGS